MGATLRRAALASAAVLGLILAVGLAMGSHDPIDLVAVAEADHGVDLEASFVETAPGVRLHVVAAGPEDGPPVLLLHGYPELWWTWHVQVAALARAGHRVFAPDLRGFHLSDKPAGVASYRMDVILDDLDALVAHTGHDAVDLAGHDFGGIAAWHYVLHRPERVRRLVVFNVSHPLTWGQEPAPAEAGEESEDQIGWFRVFARLPWLPERVARFGDWWLTAWYLRNTSQPGTFDPPVIDRYRMAWSRPDAARATLSWYRAAFAHPRRLAPPARVAAPTIVVFGMQDRFNDPRSGPGSLEFLDRGRFVPFEDAGHWILHEKPEETARLLVEFFGAP